LYKEVEPAAVFEVQSETPVLHDGLKDLFVVEMNVSLYVFHAWHGTAATIANTLLIDRKSIANALPDRSTTFVTVQITEADQLLK
jgi:hypothetical protein